MEEVLYDVISREKSPKDKISIKTQALLDVYLSEKNKQQKIDFAESE